MRTCALQTELNGSCLPHVCRYLLFCDLSQSQPWDDVYVVDETETSRSYLHYSFSANGQIQGYGHIGFGLCSDDSFIFVRSYNYMAYYIGQVQIARTVKIVKPNLSMHFAATPPSIVVSSNNHNTNLDFCSILHSYQLLTKTYL